MRPVTVNRHPGSAWAAKRFYGLSRALARWTLRALFRHRGRGVDRVPRTGPLLIVANHQSFLDPPAIGCVIDGRQLDFVARASLFKAAPFATLLRAVHAFPIDHHHADPAAMRAILERLSKGRAVLIFPEGTRSEDGSVSDFKRGIALLIKRAKCPVLPAAIEGAFDAWPRTARRPACFRCPIEVAFGECIEADALLASGPDAALERLQREVDTLRRDLHASIRRRTKGRLPTSPAPDPQPIVETQRVSAVAAAH